MLTLLTLLAVFPYLLGVGHVLLPHSFRSRATSWVTPTHVMSSLICWCHVFLGRPRRLVPGIASSITLRMTLSASRLWKCPNQRRRPPHITSSIGETCSMRRISSFRTIYYIRNKQSINYFINYVHKINPTPVRDTLLCKYTSDTDII